MKIVLARRGKPKSQSDRSLVFITKYGASWYSEGRYDEKEKKIVGSNASAITHEMGKLMKSLDINGHRNFSALRHTFRTVGRGARDREAIRALMGHVDSSIDAHYLEEGLPDERLKAVTDHVRAWLLGLPEK